MTRNTDLAWLDFLDRLTDPPSRGPIQRWGLGIAVSIIAISYATSWLLFPPDVFTLPLSSRFGRAPLTTTSSHVPASLALCILFAGLYAHFHWFWGTDRRLSNYYELPQLLALVGGGISLVYFVAALAVTT